MGLSVVDYPTLHLHEQDLSLYEQDLSLYQQILCEPDACDDCGEDRGRGQPLKDEESHGDSRSVLDLPQQIRLRAREHFALRGPPLLRES